MGKKKTKVITIKSYKTVKGRNLIYIKSKTYIRSCYFSRKLRLFIYKSNDKRNKCCSIKYKYSLEAVKSAEKEVTKEKSKKKKFWSYIFALINIGVVAGILIYQFGTGESMSLAEFLSLDANWSFLWIVLGLVALEMIAETLKTFHLIYLTTHRIRPFLSYKSTALCRYYDAITPLSSGGEPLQIFYLKKRGIRSEVATSIPIVKSMFWQMSNAILGIVLLIFNSQAYYGYNPIIITGAWIAIGATFLIIVTVLFLSISKRFGPKVVIGILKLLAKMHIIKNYQLTFRKVMRFVLDYQNCMRSFASNIFTFITQLFLALLEMIIAFSIPYFIYLMFNADALSWTSYMDILTKTMICNLASSIVPIPGGSGAAELSFLAMFSSLFKEGTQAWAMLLWRLSSYYIFIFRGVLVTIYDTVYGNKKSDALVQSGYFNEKIHFAMVRRKSIKTKKERARQQQLLEKEKLEAKKQKERQKQKQLKQQERKQKQNKKSDLN